MGRFGRHRIGDRMSHAISGWIESSESAQQQIAELFLGTIATEADQSGDIKNASELK